MIFICSNICSTHCCFQVASGAFAQLRDKLVPTMQKIPTPDLSPEVLASLTTLMQAQAQECIYIKAVADKMKEKVCELNNTFQSASGQLGEHECVLHILYFYHIFIARSCH